MNWLKEIIKLSDAICKKEATAEDQNQND